MNEAYAGSCSRFQEELWLKMDGEKESPLYWYPWRPDTGNIMYAMPEIGSTVLLEL